MKYFTVDDSLDELVVGKDFQFIKGDNPEAPEALIYFILFLIDLTVDDSLDELVVGKDFSL